MAIDDPARIAAFAAQADRSRSLAEGYVRQAMALGKTVLEYKDIVLAAFARFTVPHRWVGTRLDLLGPDGEYVIGPDLKGEPGAGDFNGPETATAENFVSFSGTGGKTGKDSGRNAASFATATQGVTADSALQPGASADVLVDGSAKKLMTSAERTKLAGIATSADVTRTVINAAPAKSTPVDGDGLVIEDSEAAGALKYLSWLNLKATLKAYFDALYQPVHANLTALAGLTGAADRFAFFTGAGAMSLATVTTFSRSVLTGVDAPAWRATLGVTGETGWDLIIEDRKAQGTSGGTNVAGNNQRALNTVAYNSTRIANSLAANALTINTAGNYMIEASAPTSGAVASHKIQLVKGASTVIAEGTSEFGSNGTTRSHLACVVALAAADVIKLNHFTGAAVSGVGLGYEASNGPEVYAQLKIKKVA